MTEVNETHIDAHSPEDFQIETNLGGGFRAVGPETPQNHPLANYIGSAVANGTKRFFCAALAVPIFIAELGRPEEFPPDSQAAPPEEPRIG